MLTWHLAPVFLASVGSFACDSLNQKYFLQLTGHKCVTPETLGVWLDSKKVSGSNWTYDQMLRAFSTLSLPSMVVSWSFAPK